MNRFALGFIAAALLLATGGAAPVTALVFSPDGSALLSNGDHRIDVRSPKDAAIQRGIPCDLAKIATIAFAPDGRAFAVGGGEPGVRGAVQILSWPDGRLLHRFGDQTDLVTSMAFDRDGTHLAVAASDHTARVWRISKQGAPSALFTLTGHAGPVLAIAFSPSGEQIVTASADRSLKVWASSDGRLLRSFTHHTDAVHALVFRPRTSGEAVPDACASAAADRTVRIWQPEIGRMVRIVRRHEEPVFALAWASDGSALFTAGKEGIIRRIDGSSDTVEARWRGNADWIYALAVSPDGAVLASGDWAGAVRLHDPRGNSDAALRPVR